MVNYEIKIIRQKMINSTFDNELGIKQKFTKHVRCEFVSHLHASVIYFQITDF